MMTKARSVEALVHQEKLIHKAWIDKAVLEGARPSKQAADLVEELLMSYAGATPGMEERSEDIYASAFELAVLLLPDTPMEQMCTVYRDDLLDTMLDFMGQSAVADECRGLIHLSNLISDAFCEARSDQLRRTIRHERAKVFSSELTLAKSIQRHLLPKVIPDIPGFEFAGRLMPATEVGGDYWSIKYYPEDEIVTMKLADISGHGVAAATLVAAVKFISGGYYRAAASAAEVMTRTNRVLVRETPHNIHVTMVYGWLRPKTYRLTMVNAGHQPAFVCRKGSCMDIKPTGPCWV